MHYWIATVKAPGIKGDKYVIRLKEDTLEAAERVAKDNDLVAENERVEFERATLENVCAMLDWRDHDFVILDQ